MKISELKTAELVSVYIQLRDRRAARKAAFTNEDSDDDAKQTKIENLLLARMAEDGSESVRTNNGTIYKYIRSSCGVADRNVFFDFVQSHNIWDLAEIRAAKKAIEIYKEESGELPPGLNWREELVLGVRRA